MALKPNWGDVTFTANVPDAQIELNGNSFMLPANFVGEQHGLAPGTYKATISCEGYKTIENDLSVVAESHRDINITMVLIEGILNNYSGRSRGRKR